MGISPQVYDLILFFGPSGFRFGTDSDFQQNFLHLDFLYITVVCCIFVCPFVWYLS